ncbi:ATP-binding cassette domain-containing protein [Nocardia sp. NPDC049220]|uniref:ATP-binding cassette domain-containing protein n=1 Tax=Nocardia sp. NPDC049220 TaxID=3155273 RepID=UPI0033EA8EF8
MAPEATAAGLHIRDLTVRIPVSRHAVVHAVTELTLRVPRGTVTALVGESGCGKSVVATTVLGQLPEQAWVTGSVEAVLDDRALDVLTTSMPLRGRHIGFVPQSPATHFTPVRTIGAQLDETIRVLGAYRTRVEVAARAGLAAEALDRYPHELSSGMAQRAAIAAALIGDPEILIADEPTSSLDRERTDDIFALLRASADTGTAVLLITHDLAALERTSVADTVAVMYASRLMEVGPNHDVLHNPWHRYTRDLLAALPERGLTPIPRTSPELTNLSPDCPYAGGPSALVPRAGRLVRERRP